MPLYDYDCSACGRRFEVVHGVHVEGPTVCPICGKGPIHKAISAPAVHFKGTGWAKRDRRATVTPGTSKATREGSSSEGEPKGGESGSASTAATATTATTATKPAEAGSTSKAE